MTISTLLLGDIFLVERVLVVLESDLFANSLMGATMQDGGKRERSNVMTSNNII